MRRIEHNNLYRVTNRVIAPGIYIGGALLNTIFVARVNIDDVTFTEVEGGYVSTEEPKKSGDGN